MTATGTWVQDIALSGGSFTDLDGLAMNQATGDVWIAARDGNTGTVYHFSGFPAQAVPEPMGLALAGLGVLGAVARSRRGR